MTSREMSQKYGTENDRLVQWYVDDCRITRTLKVRIDLQMFDYAPKDMTLTEKSIASNGMACVHKDVPLVPEIWFWSLSSISSGTV